MVCFTLDGATSLVVSVCHIDHTRTTDNRRATSVQGPMFRGFPEMSQLQLLPSTWSTAHRVLFLSKMAML